MPADRLKTLAPSPTLAVQASAKAMRAQGIDVISCGARHACGDEEGLARMPRAVWGLEG
jgi:hypothetical protein